MGILGELAKSLLHPQEIRAMLRVKYGGESLVRAEYSEPLEELAGTLSDEDFCYATLNKVGGVGRERGCGRVVLGSRSRGAGGESAARKATENARAGRPTDHHCRAANPNNDATRCRARSRP